MLKDWGTKRLLGDSRTIHRSWPGLGPAIHDLPTHAVEPTQLSAEDGNTRPGGLWHALVASLGGDSKQLFHALASHRRAYGVSERRELT
jgi:hypothetical protein